MLQAPTALTLGALLQSLPVDVLSIGASAEGRPIHGVTLGQGPLAVSIIAGCHADEPGGPLAAVELLRRLASPQAAPLLAQTTWRIVPLANPDGAERNAGWFAPVPDLRAYLEGAVRDLPGEDREFGFPRDATDPAMPETRAIADFLAGGGPVALHASLHGMAFAAGAWWLIDAAWVDRTAALRSKLTRVFNGAGLGRHDIERGGEKGFHRIASGFCTTPTSAAMAAHFLNQNDPETAARFRPTSMEFMRSLGGDPLCMVSELPLFCVEPHPGARGPVRQRRFFEGLRAEIASLRASGDDAALAAFEARFNPVPVPFAVQAEVISAAVLESVKFLLPGR